MPDNCKKPDEDIAEKIKERIIEIESDNIKNNCRNDRKMIEAIMKIFEEEVKC